MSSTSSASSESEALTPGTHYPLIKPKTPKETNWIKIGAIITAVVGVLLAGLAVLCLYDILPCALLGDITGAGMTLAVGASIALPSLYLVYKYWKSPSP